MPSWWGKSSSKEVKKKTSEENFIYALLHRKSKIPFEEKGAGGTRRHSSEIASVKGSLSLAESRLTSPSKEVSRCQSFAERPHAQPLPLPGEHSSNGHTVPKISILRPAAESSGRTMLILPSPKSDCILSRSIDADVDGDLATASVSSDCSIASVDPVDSCLVSSQGNDYEVAKAVSNNPFSTVQKDQSPISTRNYSREIVKPAKPLFTNQHFSSSPKRGFTNTFPSNLQISYNGAFGIRSAPDSSLSSPCRSPMRGVCPGQSTSSDLDVSSLGSGPCSNTGLGHNSIRGEMSGRLLWQQRKGSTECSPIPSPKIKSPGPSSRIQSGTVTPLHPRAGGGAALDSPTNCPDDGKLTSHRLPLPPITIYNSSPYSPSNSAAMISSPAPRSPGRAEIPTSPGSYWKKGKLIGGGTFGHVYVGFNSESGEMCAMKEVTLFPDDAKSRESAKQLMQEITLLSCLQHQNIVQYYGSEMVDEKLYIYLEYVSGGSIHKLLQDYGQFGELAIRSFTQQILSGLAYLHAMNTVHRDIKGANILVDTNRRVKLADFGMAKHITGQSCPLSFKGSPYWMAPEVIKNSNGCNHAVDIWSLGCTVLEMATAKPPWSQYEGVAAMFKIGNSRELPAMPDHLSDDGKDFVKQCLQRNPLHRPTAAQLLEHRFVKNVALLEKSTLDFGPLEPPTGVTNGMKSMGLRHVRPISSNYKEGLATHHLRGPKVHPATSDYHIPRYISCPVSPIGSPLLHSRSPQHINGRMSPSPISSPRTTFGSNKMVRDIDPTWSHGEAVGSKSKVQCNYCEKVLNGGITRLKQHLAHVSGQVIKCHKVPPNVTAEMKELLNASAKKKVVQQRRRTEELDACREEVFGSSDDDDEDPEMRRARRESVRSLQEEEEMRRMQYEAASRGSQYEHGGGSSGPGGTSLRRAFCQKQPRQDPDIEEISRPPTHAPQHVGPTDPFAYRKPTLKQPSIMKALNGKFGKAREHLVRATGKIFLDGGIPPNKASSPYFTTMLDAAAEHGPGLKAPTPYEIGVMRMVVLHNSMEH